MVLWRSPELEAVLGGPLDPSGLTEAALQRLVDAQAREGEQLEFKSEPYPKEPTGAQPPWSSAQEFAKDVAALANLRGGLVLIGVKEQAEVANGLNPVVVDSGAVEQRLRQVLANHAAPVPRVAFVPVPATAGGHYLAVVVPPSAAAPHAVLGRAGDRRRPLHYPVRDGADVRWMSETEVAERYRRRAEEAAARGVRTRGAVDAWLEALRRAQGLWLYVAVVPHSPAPGVLDRRAVADAEEWWRSYRFETPHQRTLDALGSAIPAPGRITITSPGYDGDEPDDPRYAYLELHVDGSAFAAAPVATNTQDGGDGTQVGEATLAEDTVLTINACLEWVTRQAGAWGEADVVIGLLDPTAAPGELMQPLTIVGRRYGVLGRLPRSRLVRAAPEAVTSADLGAAERLQDRLGVATTRWRYSCTTSGSLSPYSSDQTAPCSRRPGTCRSAPSRSGQPSTVWCRGRRRVCRQPCGKSVRVSPRQGSRQRLQLTGMPGWNSGPRAFCRSSSATETLAIRASA